ncbi:hypothetical protein EYC84_004079 [Monilinia fructicola]|uniref:Uncharacterized protein n=1 Tax=Monilinia fructicola TaxID=38448 RepID=A0A5M9K7M1_MONFR|nr:hypothetical protein EYC84_004079 [Monilinia fructicola]
MLEKRLFSAQPVWGLVFAAKYDTEHLYDPTVLSRLLLANWLCMTLIHGTFNTWNDILDANIDILVTRTKIRPISTARITRSLAILGFLIHLAGSIDTGAWLSVGSLFAVYAAWAIYFDTAYGLQDLRDDRKLKVGSLAQYVGPSLIKPFLTTLGVLSLALLTSTAIRNSTHLYLTRDAPS